MSLDIKAAPAITADVAAAGPPGSAAAGGLLAVFRVLLAQAAAPPGDPVPKPTPTITAKSTSLPDTATELTATATKAKTAALASLDQKASDGKNQSAITQTVETPPIPIVIVPIVIVPIVMAPLAPPPLPSVGVVKTNNPGKVMDTAPVTGGESLSQTSTQGKLSPAPQVQASASPVFAAPALATPPPTAQTQAAFSVAAAPAAQALTASPVQLSAAPVPPDVIVPTEPAASPQTPGSPAITPLVPTFAVQASQAVIVPATPAKAMSAKAPPAKAGPATLAPATPVPATTTSAKTPSLAADTSSVLQNAGPSADNQAGKITGPTPSSPAAASALAPVRSPKGEPMPAVKASAGKTAAVDRAAPAHAAPQTAAPQTAAPGLTALNVPQTAAPPTPSAAVMPAPDQTRMVHQVADGIQALTVPVNNGGPRQVTVQLHPHDWGQLHVSVTMTPKTGADGKVITQVVAHVVAENATVKAALETRRSDLRHALQGAGLHLDTLTVTVQSPSGGAQAGLGNDRQPGANDGWTGAQPQTGGTGNGGDAAFQDNGNRQSGFTDFTQGDPSGRRPSKFYETDTRTSGTAMPDLSVASISRSGPHSRVDIHA